MAKPNYTYEKRQKEIAKKKKKAEKHLKKMSKDSEEDQPGQEPLADDKENPADNSV
jgi:hypothetical protein